MLLIIESFDPLSVRVIEDLRALCFENELWNWINSGYWYFKLSLCFFSRFEKRKKEETFFQKLERIVSFYFFLHRRFIYYFLRKLIAKNHIFSSIIDNRIWIEPKSFANNDEITISRFITGQGIVEWSHYHNSMPSLFADYELSQLIAWSGQVTLFQFELLGNANINRFGLILRSWPH